MLPHKDFLSTSAEHHYHQWKRIHRWHAYGWQIIFPFIMCIFLGSYGSMSWEGTVVCCLCIIGLRHAIHERYPSEAEYSILVYETHRGAHPHQCVYCASHNICEYHGYAVCASCRHRLFKYE